MSEHSAFCRKVFVRREKVAKSKCNVYVPCTECVIYVPPMVERKTSRKFVPGGVCSLGFYVVLPYGNTVLRLNTWRISRLNKSHLVSKSPAHLVSKTPHISSRKVQHISSRTVSHIPSLLNVPHLSLLLLGLQKALGFLSSWHPNENEKENE